MADITWIDIIIVAVFLISAVIALLRGFVREVVSIATWGAALWLAFSQSGQVALLLPETIDVARLSFGDKQYGVNLRVIIAFVLIMVGVLILGALINFVLCQFMKAKMLQGLDRMLGVVFGLLRAAVVATLLIMAAAAFTTLPATSTWQSSRLVKPFEQAAVWVVRQLPERYARWFKLPAGAAVIEIQP